VTTEEDRSQIGITPAGQVTIDRLTKDLGWFSEGQDAARFALAYAIRQGVSEGQAKGVSTRWATNLFDPRSELQAILRAVYPGSSTPIRLMEHLIDEGLRLIAERLDEGQDSPTVFFATVQGSVAADK
jgi:hypothetical protein